MMGIRRVEARIALGMALGLLLAGGARAGEGEPALSDASRECLECHRDTLPGLHADWSASRHARVTPAQAMQRPALESRLSSREVPEALRDHVVGCFECHGLRPDVHQDTFDHMGYRVHVVVTPDDCATCHAEEAKQFAGSTKAFAYHNLMDNPLYKTLVDTITGKAKGAAEISCLSCHGTRVEVTGMEARSDPNAGDFQVPRLSGWPNNGVGRVNPDGSRGSCAACHTRHRFSVATARDPHTCAQCHVEPDTPAWEVYKDSKHGNLVLAHHDAIQWEAIPWRVGVDLPFPTCATCHNALLVDNVGKVLAPRTHDFGARVWVRLFGLVASHPQPVHGDTRTLRNAEGQPLATTYEGQPAARGLIDAKEQARRRAGMQAICNGCHSTTWSNGHFAHLDDAVRATDAAVAEASRLVGEAWAKGRAERANPFDEPMERLWLRLWLFYANSIRYSVAMCGPDHAAFKEGFFQVTETLAKLREMLGR